MAEPTFDTLNLRAWLERIQAGDPLALDELVRAAQSRLEVLARRMLRKYPSVARWADTGDVFTNAALRLLRALENTQVADTREFFNLSAAVIRRELIDLVRHFQGPHGLGANHASVVPKDGGPPALDPADPSDGDELDRWAAFHQAVEKLPPKEREVFSLTFYHGWTQPQIAELFGVDERTVRRYFRAAAQSINEAVGGELPGS